MLIKLYMTNYTDGVAAMMNRRSKEPGGFTLLEMLLVLSIIGLAIAVVIPRAMRAQTESKFNLVRQYGSEIAGYIVTWAEGQARAQRENTNYTIKDFLVDDINAADAGFSSRRLADHYTGNEAYNGVESLVAPDKLPRNPFNQASYFNSVNDDEDVPSRKAGLLYLAVQQDPLDREYLNFYLLFTSTGEDSEGSRWYGGMDHEDEEGIRRGVFVARLYDEKEDGGRTENLYRWKRRMR